MMQLPTYDNRYILDITYGAWLILVSVVIFLAYFCVLFYDVYEDGCTAYECGAAGIELLVIFLFTAASAWFVYLSYPVQLKEDIGRIMEFASCESIEKQKSFGERYVWGTNMCLLMWLFLIAIIPFLAIPIWAYIDGDFSLAEFLIYLFVFVAAILFLAYWLVAAFPESVLMNKMRGSSFFYDACLACCLGPLFDGTTNDFSAPSDSFAGTVQRHLGSDFLVGAWFFLLGSLVQLVLAVYLVCIDYTGAFAWTFLVASLLLALGSALFVYTAYPNNAFSRYWWCLSTCQAEDREMERKDAETQALL